MRTNTIGLDTEQCAALAEKLNLLLADYQLFYINVRGFHWNVRGEKFFELHIKFEELYNDLLLKVDEIAERILTLSHTPAHAYSAYLKTSFLAEVGNISDGKEAVREMTRGFSILLVKQREILAMASNAGDEGTSALMSDYIRQQEKLVWMYSAYLA